MDPKFKQRVDDFLAQKNIAIAGYSSKEAAVGNGLYDKFEKNGYTVFAINPKAEEVVKVPCYPNLKSVPEKIEAVMIATPPQGTKEIIKECIELGIKHAWVHRSFGNGSYNEEAIKLAEENGIEIIPMACPMMFLKADVFHKCVKWFMKVGGKLKV